MLFYVRVRHLDKAAEGCSVCGRSRFQLDMTHEFATALQQAGWIGERCAAKESHINRRSEDIDVGERSVAQACNRTAVMQDFADFVAAFAHRFKPVVRDGSQFTLMLFHPGVDRGIAFEDAIQAQDLVVVSFHVHFSDLESSALPVTRSGVRSLMTPFGAPG